MFAGDVSSTFAMRSIDTDSQLRQMNACMRDGKYGHPGVVEAPSPIELAGGILETVQENTNRIRMEPSKNRLEKLITNLSVQDQRFRILHIQGRSDFLPVMPGITQFLTNLFSLLQQSLYDLRMKFTHIMLLPYVFAQIN